MIVIDASVLAIALGDDGPSGDRARARMRGETLAAPEIIDLEVLSVWRRTIRDERRAKFSITDLEQAPLMRCPHAPLLPRCWELRDNLSPYDAAYVALAELLDASLLTGDRRLARAPGIRCNIEAVG